MTDYWVDCPCCSGSGEVQDEIEDGIFDMCEECQGDGGYFEEDA